MKRIFLAAAVALSLPCCMTSCAVPVTKAEVFRTLAAAGIGALQGAIPATTAEIREIQAERAAARRAAKAPVPVLP